MSRRMSNKNVKEYAELIKFIDIYSTKIENINHSDDVHPLNIAKKIEERFGKSMALKGAKQAINDIIEDTQDLSYQKLNNINSILKSHGSLTLTELRMRYWKKYNSIRKKNEIKNDTEYHHIMGILNDLSSEITDSEWMELNNIVRKYEQQKVDQSS